MILIFAVSQAGNSGEEEAHPVKEPLYKSEVLDSKADFEKEGQDSEKVRHYVEESLGTYERVDELEVLGGTEEGLGENLEVGEELAVSSV